MILSSLTNLKLVHWILYTIRRDDNKEKKKTSSVQSLLLFILVTQSVSQSELESLQFTSFSVHRGQFLRVFTLSSTLHWREKEKVERRKKKKIVKDCIDLLKTTLVH